MFTEFSQLLLAVADLMVGELPADVGEGIAVADGGGAYRAVECVGGAVEISPVRGAQPDAGARLGQVVQLGVAEQHDLRVRSVCPDLLQGAVELGRQLGQRRSSPPSRRRSRTSWST